MEVLLRGSMGYLRVCMDTCCCQARHSERGHRGCALASPGGLGREDTVTAAAGLSLCQVLTAAPQEPNKADEENLLMATRGQVPWWEAGKPPPRRRYFSHT